MQQKLNSKYLLYAVVTAVTGLIAWGSIYNLFYLGKTNPFGAPDLAFPVIAFFLFTLASSFFALVSTSNTAVLFTFGAVLLGVFFLFGLTSLGSIAPMLAGVLILVLVFLFLSWRGLLREREGRIRFELGRLLRRFLPAFFTANIILISFLSFFSPSIASSFEEIIIPRPVFTISLKSIEPVIKSQIPAFSFDMPIDDFLVTVSLFNTLSGKKEKTPSKGVLPPVISPDLLTQIQKGGFDPGAINFQSFLGNTELLRLLEGEAQQQLKTMSRADIEKMHQDFGKSFGVTITSNQTLGDVFYAIAVAQLNRLNKEHSSALPLTVAVTLFFMLKTLSFFFMWTVLLGAAFIFKILRNMKFVVIEELDIKKEVLVVGE